MLTLSPATPPDAASLTTLFLKAFTHPFNHKLFPRTPATTTWWTTILASSITHPHKTVLKITDTERDNLIVAFAVWDLPSCTEKEELPVLPDCCDEFLCGRLFGVVEKMKGEVMGERRFYYLHILATHPDYRGQGLASRLIQWGLERAEKDNLEAFLAASPMGKAIYEKMGFEVRATEEIAEGYVHAYMVWTPSSFSSALTDYK